MLLQYLEFWGGNSSHSFKAIPSFLLKKLSRHLCPLYLLVDQMMRLIQEVSSGDAQVDHPKSQYIILTPYLVIRGVLFDKTTCSCHFHFVTLLWRLVIRHSEFVFKGTSVVMCSICVVLIWRRSHQSSTLSASLFCWQTTLIPSPSPCHSFVFSQLDGIVEPGLCVSFVANRPQEAADSAAGGRKRRGSMDSAGSRAESSTPMGEARGVATRLESAKRSRAELATPPDSARRVSARLSARRSRNDAT